MKKMVFTKMMRPKWREVILTSMMLLSLNLSAQEKGGQGSGNGGGAFVCYDQNHSTTRVYSYDVWSVENNGVILDNRKYYIDILENNDPAINQVYKALGKIKNYNSDLYNNLINFANGLNEKINEELKRKFTGLQILEDFLPKRSPYQKDFCQGSMSDKLVDFKTLINYDDYLMERHFQKEGSHYKDIAELSLALKKWYSENGYRLTTEEKYNSNYIFSPSYILSTINNDFILVDQALYLAMENETHRAALILHEIFYKLMRGMFNHDNSETAIELVGLVMGDYENLLFKKLDSLYLAENYPLSKLEDKWVKLIKNKHASGFDEILKYELTVKNKNYVLKNYLLDKVKKVEVEGLNANLSYSFFYVKPKIIDLKFNKWLTVMAMIHQNRDLLIYIENTEGLDLNIELEYKSIRLKLIAFINWAKSSSNKAVMSTCGLFNKEVCLKEAKDVANKYLDTLKGFGFPEK